MSVLIVAQQSFNGRKLIRYIKTLNGRKLDDNIHNHNGYTVPMIVQTEGHGLLDANNKQITKCEGEFSRQFQSSLCSQLLVLDWCAFR